MIQLIEVVAFDSALQTLMGEKMPARLAYAIAKNKRLAEQELAAFHEGRKAILERYGEKQPDGNYELHDQDAADKEFKELVQQETDFSPYKAPVALFDGVNVAPLQMAQLSLMIEDDTQDGGRHASTNRDNENG